jgi:FG-GAP repeat
MRRVAWVVVVVLAVAALAVPAWEPAVAQPATVPTPDFDHDGFGDLAVGAPGETVGGTAEAGDGFGAALS